MSSLNETIWGVMPAAGIGSRMQLKTPKQYLKVAGKTVLEHSMSLLLDLPQLSKMVVCVSSHDAVFETLPNHPQVFSTQGGETRADSVLNGLRALDQAQHDDWVLVHDAARPCLPPLVLQRLVTELVGCDVSVAGGILALPAQDTLKQATLKPNLLKPSKLNECEADQVPYIAKTLDRSVVWQAQTPQMFRYGVLRESLEHCLQNNWVVTDEASALELNGHAVKLIEGSAQNIKITTQHDLKLAEFLLSQNC